MPESGSKQVLEFAAVGDTKCATWSMLDRSQIIQCASATTRYHCYNANVLRRLSEPHSCRRCFDGTRTRVAVAMLSNEARGGGKPERDSARLLETDLKMQSQTSIAVRVGSIVFEEFEEDVGR